MPVVELYGVSLEMQGGAPIELYGISLEVHPEYDIIQTPDVLGCAGPAEIADAVWDEARAGHNAAGSFGESNQAIPPTAVQIRQEMDANSVDLDAIGALVTAISNRIPAALVGGKMDSALAAAERDAIAAALLDLANGVETGYTVRQALRLIAAATAGKSSGDPAGPVKFRNLPDTADRITATIDADGNRTSVTHNP